MNKQYIKWERCRDKGRCNYILKHGALRWVVVFAIFLSLLSALIFPEHFKSSFLIALVFSLPFFSLIGIAYGYMMWNINEAIYQENNTTPNKQPDRNREHVMSHLRTVCAMYGHDF